MSAIRLERWIEGGRRILRLLGTFDGAAASHLLTHLQRETAGPQLVIDVALLRGFDEVGVAALARLVEGGAGRRIALRGLSTHQLRILRYLGAGLSKVAVGNVP